MAIICDTEGSALTMYSHGTTIVGEKKRLGIYWYQQLEVWESYDIYVCWLNPMKSQCLSVKFHEITIHVG